MHGRVSMIDAGVHLWKEGRGAVMSACMLVGWFRMIDAGGYIDGRRGGQLLVSTPREVGAIMSTCMQGRSSVAINAHRLGAVPFRHA